MAYCLALLRSLPFFVALCALSALMPAHAQQVTSSSAHLAPGLTLLLETAPFILDEHEVIDDEDTGWIIDGCREFFGTDNDIPGLYLREAFVLLEGHWHSLDTSCMYACESCSFDASDVKVVPNPGGAGYRLEGRFSDGAGTYYATWLVTPMGTARMRIVEGPVAARLSMFDYVGEATNAATIPMIDSVIDELNMLKRELEDSTVTPSDAEWIRELVATLDLRRRANTRQ